LSVDELAIAAACYARHAPPPADRPADELAAQDRQKYGLFGWRFWFLTPIVALFYARIASIEDLTDFLRAPAGHTHRHWRASHPRLTRWLYPGPRVASPG